MDAIRNRTVKGARRSGRSVVPLTRCLGGGNASARRVPAGFRPGSYRRARVGDRNPGSVARIPLPQARGGTQEGPNGDRAAARHAARGPLNAGFLSLKHSRLSQRVLVAADVAASQTVSQEYLSMTGRRNETQVSGMI
jgi:hypothetical protein